MGKKGELSGVGVVEEEKGYFGVEGGEGGDGEAVGGEEGGEDSSGRKGSWRTRRLGAEEEMGAHVKRRRRKEKKEMGIVN